MLDHDDVSMPFLTRPENRDDRETFLPQQIKVRDDLSLSKESKK